MKTSTWVILGVGAVGLFLWYRWFKNRKAPSATTGTRPSMTTAFQNTRTMGQVAMGGLG